MRWVREGDQTGQKSGVGSAHKFIGRAQCWVRRGGDDLEDIIHNSVNNSGLPLDFTMCHMGRRLPAAPQGSSLEMGLI